ncbi:MAG: epoxyqueuosine reductase QueH [Spirochaetes bacterium]|nr:epoxyqueuosine reductase QueH [Spirochaetota bacterium]
MLLHTCCAPCAAGCMERLRNEELTVILFYSNSNIFPRGEYEKRLREAERLASIYGLDLIRDEYNHDGWLEAVAGLEKEPEKGRRCLVCFEYSLRRSSLRAKQEGISQFATTLTLSPHKVSAMVFEAGKKFSGFVPMDFKKKGGQVSSRKISVAHGLYRQRYCGCEFSLQTGKGNVIQ